MQSSATAMPKNAIKIRDKVFKINVDKRIHLLMRELTLRKRPETKQSIAEQYENALREYLERERVPKQIEKITRTSIRFNVTEEFLQLIEALRLIAKKRRQPLPVLLEELCEQYLNKPENYLGKNFYARHQRKIEVVK